jgi:hypothetical protein
VQRGWGRQRISVEDVEHMHQIDETPGKEIVIVIIAVIRKG